MYEENYKFSSKTILLFSIFFEEQVQKNRFYLKYKCFVFEIILCIIRNVFSVTTDE